MLLTKLGIAVFIALSAFQLYRISLQGLAEFQFKPVIEEIPKAYSLNTDERQGSIANISNGGLWLEVLNRIRFAIQLDPDQARYHRWLGLAYTARAVAVPSGSVLQQNLLLEADQSFLKALQLNPPDAYTVEHVLLTKARLNDFGAETENLLKNIVVLAPRETQIHLQLILEYLPRYSVLPPEIKKQVDSLYLQVNATGGTRTPFIIRSYSKRLKACRLLGEDETTAYLRWPEHICNDIAARHEKTKRFN